MFVAGVSELEERKAAIYREAEGGPKKKAKKRPEKFANMEEYRAWMRSQGDGF